MANIKRDKLIYWILIGNQRKLVLRNFPDKQITAEQLRKIINNKASLKLSLREMSRHLTSFSKRKLIKCLNQNAPYNRYYSLTPIGNRIKEKICNLI